MDAAIKRETAGRLLAIQDEGWHTLGVSACREESVCGRSAIIMDRSERAAVDAKGIRNTFF